MTEIHGRVAFVTGGGGSIGGAIAKALAAEGAAVAVADILPDHAHEVVNEITAAGGTAVPVICDQSDRASLRRAKEEANEALLGPVTLLFAIAGASSWQRLDETSDDDVDYMFGVNQMGVVDSLRVFVPDMIEAGGGHVLGTASVAGLSPAALPYHSLYSSAKLAVVGLMMGIEYELAEVGIRSTVLIPSGVVTKMSQSLPRYRPQRFGGPIEGPIVAPDVVRRIFEEQQRVWRPAEEVAEMVLLAVRENYPIVVTDSLDRNVFQETYVNALMAAFDRVEAFERSLGNRAGRALSFDEMKAGPQAK
jgi:NAD(P)-dependent dehydrogenase (short-subunit alcohol dehydrogenase family)